MNRRVLKVGVIVAVSFLWFLNPGVASAHALLVRAAPAPDTVLRSSPPAVHLWFTEDLNGGASRIVVWDRYRHVENIGSAHLVPGQPRQLEVPLKHLAPGSYLVLWTSVSSEDGHLLRGSYIFSVKHRGPGPSLAGVNLGGQGQSFPDAPTLASLLAHWLELLAAVTWAGAATISLLVYAPFAARLVPESVAVERRLLRRLLLSSLIVLFISSALILLMQAYGVAGNDWSHVLDRSTITNVLDVQYGQLWIARQIMVVVAIVYTLALSLDTRRAPAGGFESGAPALIGLVYLYVFAASGHAASAHIGDLPAGHLAALASISILMDWLHFVADALWFGGQIYIALVLIPAVWRARNHARNGLPFLEILNRFSPAAYVSIGLYIVSGIFSAKVHIPSWYAFFNSIYGRALIVKVLLIGTMMLVSAFTVYLLRPRIRKLLTREDAGAESAGRRRLDSLAGWLRLNPVLGVGVLLATSAMYYYPVPQGFGPPGPAAYTASVDNLVATLSLSPDRSGPNRITVRLKNKQGQPVQQAHVSVLTTMLDMFMGTGLASLNEVSPGVFTGQTDLGMGGHWRLQILIYQPSGLERMSVQVRVGT